MLPLIERGATPASDDPTDGVENAVIAGRPIEIVYGGSDSTPDSGEDLRCPGFNPNLSDLTLTGESETEFEHPSGAYAATFTSVFRSEANARASFARSANESDPSIVCAIGLSSASMRFNAAITSRSHAIAETYEAPEPPRGGGRIPWRWQMPGAPCPGRTICRS